MVLEIVDHYSEGWDCKYWEAGWFNGCESAFTRATIFGAGNGRGFFTFEPDMVELPIGWHRHWGGGNRLPDSG